MRGLLLSALGELRVLACRIQDSGRQGGECPGLP